VLWNGPLGAFEYKPFEQSSIKVAQVIKKNSKLLKIDTIAGGGDTISAIKMAKAEGGFSYISNAGGAFLEWLEGNQSPGVLALKDN
jgi:phosphoglycerate kinase